MVLNTRDSGGIDEGTPRHQDQTIIFNSMPVSGRTFDFNRAPWGVNCRHDSRDKVDTHIFKQSSKRVDQGDTLICRAMGA